MVRKILVIILIVSLKLSAQSLEVFASTDTTDYLVGDYIKYRIELNYDNNVRIDSIFVKDSIKTLEYISTLPVQTGEKDNKNYELHEFIFSKYDSSTVTIPPVPIRFYIANEKDPSVIYTNEVNIRIHTLPVKPNGDIKDVKSPIKIPFDWVWIAIIIAGILILLAIIYFVYKKYFYKNPEGKKLVKKVIIPPHKEALQKLYNLQERKLWQQGKIKDYHSEITEIMRDYFEKRYKFKALEMTSSEIIENLRNTDEAGIILDETREFLSNADLVKFAKFEPMPTVNEEMMKQAIEIVKRTAKEEEEKLVEVQEDVE